MVLLDLAVEGVVFPGGGVVGVGRAAVHVERRGGARHGAARVVGGQRLNGGLSAARPFRGRAVGTAEAVHIGARPQVGAGGEAARTTGGDAFRRRRRRLGLDVLRRRAAEIEIVGAGEGAG